jgi:hypothetical protein
VLWNEEAVDALCCVYAERSDLSYIATQREANRQHREVKRIARRLTEQTRIHLRGEAGGDGGGGARVREPSSHTLLPQRGRAHLICWSNSF